MIVVILPGYHFVRISTLKIIKLNANPLDISQALLINRKVTGNINGLLPAHRINQADMTYCFSFQTLNLFFATKQKNLIKKLFLLMK